MTQKKEKRTFFGWLKWAGNRYFIRAMSSMALGLFSSLIIGLILSQLSKLPFLSWLAPFAEVVSASSPVVGSAIGVAVAHGLGAKPLVMFSSAVTGAVGYNLGGPVGAFLASVVGAELGGLVAGRTPVDIVLVPVATIVTGGLTGTFVGPGVSALMTGLGDFINRATQLAPVPMGIVVSTVMGLCLTAPISSAAIAISLGLDGLAAGAAAVGCSAQMIGFAVMSFPENRWGGLAAQGLGTSMLQMGNIVRNPRIWIPPTLASAITGPLATCLFRLEMNGPAVSSGMGTCGLVGQIGVYTGWVSDVAAGTKAAITGMDWLGLVLISFVLPAVLTWLIAVPLRRWGWIREGDLKLDL